MDVTFFAGNRAKLKELEPTALIVIAGNDEVQRRADAAFAFVQEANFYYLTGVNEPGWKLVLTPDEEFLIGPERSDAQTLFDGSLAHEEVTRTSGVTTVVSLKEGEARLKELASVHKKVLTILEHPYQSHFGFAPNPGPDANIRKLKKMFEELGDVRTTVTRMRAIKQPEELAMIRRAIHASIAGFSRVRAELLGYDNERKIEATLWYEFLQMADGHAYDPIVASGANACTLHYTANAAKLEDGSLVLIDAGAQVGEYAADITRTYAYGASTDRQKAVHAAVETAHQKIIALLRPGLEIKTYSDQVDEILKGALKSVGLYEKPSDYRRYFPHAISHGLGIDVHDSLGGFKEFQPGMVLTVEPGIYIPEEGIGVRIEDDILITEDSHENLSAALPTLL